jgi:hypothetical protein
MVKNNLIRAEMANDTWQTVGYSRRQVVGYFLSFASSEQNKLTSEGTFKVPYKTEYTVSAFTETQHTNLPRLIGESLRRFTVTGPGHVVSY